jgi:predicted N-formylglutamate amidohydrolase
MTEANPPPVSVVNPHGGAHVVLLCEHASNIIPARFGTLGLAPAQLERHIAYDIGAAAVAREIAARLDAVLVLSGYSRLLIDCNRPLASPTSIPVRSDHTDIPGNIGLTPEQRAERDALFFAPFRERVAALLDGRLREGRPTVLIGMHSFTPVFDGESRRWHAGVLWRQSEALARLLLAGLSADPALVVGDNEPYRVTLDSDYTVPWVGEARGIATALFEVRQDLIADPVGQAAWGERLAGVLMPLAR